MKNSRDYNYSVLYKLLYKGKLVGYRIKRLVDERGYLYTYVGYEKRYEKFHKWEEYYDIDLEDFENISKDLGGLGIYGDEKDTAPVLTLINAGEYLKPDDITKYEPSYDVNFIEYATYMNLPRFRKSHLDKKIIGLQQTDSELKKLYDYYNELLFDGKLPYAVSVKYNTKTQGRAGCCKMTRGYDNNGRPAYKNFEIELSTKYIERFPEDDYRSTLIHEMIHVATPGGGHGSEFMFKMNQINRDFGDKLGFKVTRNSLGSGTYNYKYACKNCEVEFEAIRRVDLERYHCAKCKSKFYVKEDAKKGVFYNKEGEVIEAPKSKND